MPQLSTTATAGTCLPDSAGHDHLRATRAGADWRDGRPFRNSSPERIRREVEGSPRRLRTDYVDIYLDASTMSEIDRIVAEAVPDPIGPESMARPVGSGERAA